MKNLIPMNKEGLLVTKDKEVMVESRYIADVFEKEHKTVMRDIRILIDKLQGIESDLGGYKFVPSSYKTVQGKKQPCYLLNRNAFTLLVMGYTTPKALEFKVWYINKFDEMENLLYSMLALREDYPEFTRALASIDIDNKYRFSIENDLIYKLATGKRARDWRMELGLNKGESIRPYLNEEQNKLILKIQQYDTFLMDIFPTYEDRKIKLKNKFGSYVDKD